jgi:hypothetical protein
MTGIELVVVAVTSAIPAIFKKVRDRRAVARSVELEVALANQRVQQVKLAAVEALFEAEQQSWARHRPYGDIVDGTARDIYQR